MEGAPADEITVLIVDDHEVVREGLRLSLSRAPHIRVIGEASEGKTALALVAELRAKHGIRDRRRVKLRPEPRPEQLMLLPE